MSRPELVGIELRRRAGRGVLLLALRGATVLVLGVGANIALARMLVPSDFGLVALGTVFVVAGGQLAYGIGAGLIRGEREPSRDELAAVNALQLVGAVVVALGVAAAAVPIGRDGFVVATMAASAPIIALRAPATITLERRLSYREISVIEVVEAIAFYTWSLTAVALGMGVWGIATGMLVRAFTGTTLLARLAPVGLLRPRWSWTLARPQLGFGMRFQAMTLAAVVRDQGVNVAVAAVAGVATLGVWNLAWRILQMPLMVATAVGRVAYPTVARLLDAGEDPRRELEGAAAVLALGMGVLLTGIAGIAPAVPILVGDGWEDVPATLLWSSMALVIGSSIGFVAVGYLVAVDDVGAVVRFTLAAAAAWLAVTLALVTWLGAPAVGLGWIAGATLNACLVARRTRAHCGARMIRSVAFPVGLALVAIGIGWSAARLGGGSVPAAAMGLVVGQLVLLGGTAVIRPRLLRGAVNVTTDAMSKA